MSTLLGGYKLITNSETENLISEVEKLSGPKADTDEWRKRRELNAHLALLHKADDTRFWRHFWGSIEFGTGTIILSTNRNLTGLGVSSLFFGLSAYHFLYKKADERFVDLLQKSAISIDPSTNRYSFLFRFTF